MTHDGGTTAFGSTKTRYDEALYRRARDLLIEHLVDIQPGHDTVSARGRDTAAAFADRVAWGSDAFVLRRIDGWGALSPSHRVCARLEARRDAICGSDHRFRPGACQFGYDGIPITVVVCERRAAPREAGCDTERDSPPRWFPVRWRLPTQRGEGVVEPNAVSRLGFDDTVAIDGDETQWIELPPIPTAELTLWAVDPNASGGRPDEKSETVGTPAVQQRWD